MHMSRTVPVTCILVLVFLGFDSRTIAFVGAQSNGACGTVAPCLFSALELNATYSNGIDYKWTVPQTCLTALNSSTVVYVEDITTAANRYCSLNITASSPESGTIACRGLTPNTAYNIAIDLGSCARRTLRFSTPGTCWLSTASLDCAAGSLSFQCINGSTAVVEVRRPTFDTYGAVAFPSDWTSIFLNISSSPFTITGLQPLDQIRLKTIFGSWNLARWFMMSCPPPGSYASNSTTGSLQNVAIFGTATQSSTHYGGPASKAIDGNTNATLAGNSLSYTEYEWRPWWKISLDQLYQVSQVVIYNRLDCCSSRLANFDVTLRDPYDTIVAAWYQATTPSSPFVLNVTGVVSSLSVRFRSSGYLHMAEVKIIACPAPLNVTCASAKENATAQVVCPAGTVITNVTEARFGQLSGSCAGSLSGSSSCPGVNVRSAVMAQCFGKAMCTVKAAAAALNVPDPCVGYLKTVAIRVTCGCASQNVAPLGSATQSSDGSGGIAQRAIDGTTDGNFNNLSVTLTNNTNTPWWKVMLDRSYEVSQIVIYPRTDCCQSRLANFDVSLRDAADVQVATFYVGPAVTTPLTLGVTGVVGLSVTIQLRGSTDPLSLAEVQVFACRPSSVTSTACKSNTDLQSFTLGCPSGQYITGIAEATYGSLTSGNCSSTFTFDPTCAQDVREVFLSQSINRKSTTFYVAPWTLTGVDPCPNTTKTLAVRANCADQMSPWTSTTPCARAVEKNWLVIGCPAGLVITNITEAVFGTPIGTCAGGFTPNPSCYADMTNFLSSLFIGLEQASIYSYPSTLGYTDPCPGVRKTLYARATCGIGTGLPQQVAQCDYGTDGSQVDLLCPAGQVITAVSEANYGTVAGSCSVGFSVIPTCNLNATATVLGRCFMRQGCAIPVWSSTFGTVEPCAGVVKALAVRVTCGPLPAPTIGGTCSVMPESTNVTLSCPANQYISSIVQSDYGLIAGSCADTLYVSPECSVGFWATRMVVGPACLGKASCSVTTSAARFGSAGCPAVQKNLAVNVTCGPKPCGTTTLVMFNQCVDLNIGADLNTVADANPINWPCNGAQNQKWLIVPRADGVSVQLVNTLSGLCAGVAGATTEDSIKQLQCDAASATQAWTVIKGYQWYGLQLKATTYCITQVSQPFGAPILMLQNCLSPLDWTQLFSLPGANFATCTLTTY